MREIKFRAWHPKGGDDPLFAEGDMLYFEPLEENQEMYIPLGYTEIMQSVGIKDKKGTKIYEGDIVRYGTGQYKCDIWLVKWSQKNCAFELKNRLTRYGAYGFIDMSAMLETLEVIGNIWETPELLETYPTQQEG